MTDALNEMDYNTSILIFIQTKFLHSFAWIKNSTYSYKNLFLQLNQQHNSIKLSNLFCLLEISSYS